MKIPKHIWWDEGNGIGTKKRQNDGVKYVPAGSELRGLKKWLKKEIKKCNRKDSSFCHECFAMEETVREIERRMK